MDTSGAPSVGGIVRAAVDVYRRHFVVLVVTAGVLGLPARLAGLGANPLEPSAGTLLTFVVGGLLALLASIAAVSQVATALRGGTPTLADGVTVGLHRLLPVSWALMLTTTYVLVVAVPLALLLAVGGWMAWSNSAGFDDPLFRLEAAVLLLVWLVPVTFVMLRCFAVVQVATLEPDAPPLRRSTALARGAYWRISVIGLVVSMVYAVPSALGGASSAAPLLGTETFAIPLQLAGWAANALALPLTAALVTTTYVDQRARLDAASSCPESSDSGR